MFLNDYFAEMIENIWKAVFYPNDMENITGTF